MLKAAFAQQSGNSNGQPNVNPALAAWRRKQKIERIALGQLVQSGGRWKSAPRSAGRKLQLKDLASWTW